MTDVTQCLRGAGGIRPCRKPATENGYCIDHTCSEPECDRPTFANGMCQPHHGAARYAANRESINANHAAYRKANRAAISSRKAESYAANRAAVAARKADLNANGGRDPNKAWAGNVGYFGAHQRPKSVFGSAKKWQCETGCGQQAKEWAYSGLDPNETTKTLADNRSASRSARKVSYSQHHAYYIALCHGCHTSLDMEIAQLRRQGDRPTEIDVDWHLIAARWSWAEGLTR